MESSWTEEVADRPNERSVERQLPFNAGSFATKEAYQRSMVTILKDRHVSKEHSYKTKGITIVDVGVRSQHVETLQIVAYVVSILHLHGGHA